MNLDALMDTPRIYTALAEWGACILYVLLLRRKVTGWKLPVSLAGSLLVFIAYQEFAGTLPIYFWIPCMIGAAFSDVPPSASALRYVPGWMPDSAAHRHWFWQNLPRPFTGSFMSGGR